MYVGVCYCKQMHYVLFLIPDARSLEFVQNPMQTKHHHSLLPNLQFKCVVLGEIGISKSLNKTGIYGAASVRTTLQAGEKKSLTIILSWYYPHRDLAKVHVGNMYSALFESSQDVAKHMRNDLLESVIDIQSWHQPIVGTDPVKRKPINEMVKDIPGASKESTVNELPDWLKDLLVNSMSFWRSGFWTEDGRWRQWEAFDCNDIDTIQNDMQRIIPYTLFFPGKWRDSFLSFYFLIGSDNAMKRVVTDKHNNQLKNQRRSIFFFLLGVYKSHQTSRQN